MEGGCWTPWDGAVLAHALCQEGGMEGLSHRRTGEPQDQAINNICEAAWGAAGRRPGLVSWEECAACTAWACRTPTPAGRLQTAFQADVWERGETAGVPDLFTCAPMLLAALAPCWSVVGLLLLLQRKKKTRLLGDT